MMFKKPTTTTVVSSIVVFIIIGIIVFTSWVLYNRTVNILTDNLRQGLLSISITEAANLNGEDINALLVEEDWQKPEWTKVVSSLHKAKYSNSESDIVFMYILRYTKDEADDPGLMEFVADADSIDPYANTGTDTTKYVDVNRDGLIEPDGPDKLQWPGQIYEGSADIPEARLAYDKPITVKELYTDEYGTVLTGYAPIKDSNGKVVAILGTDIKADDFFTITTRTLEPFLIFIFVLSVIITLLILIIIYFWERNAERLKSLDKLKTEFLSLATHQLQSPLSAMIGHTSMLLEGFYGAITDAQKEILDRILQSSKSLSYIIGDFLNVSKIESGGMKYAKVSFDFSEVVKSMVKDLSLVAEKKGLTLKYAEDKSGPFKVNGDKEKLRQVVLNYLDNAIKYSKTGIIKIEVGHKNGDVIFAVQDNGMGISPEILPTLFQKFARGDGNKMNTGGSGIGLYLVKEIVKAHGGQAWAESEGEGKGSTFFVSLPV